MTPGEKGTSERRGMPLPLPPAPPEHPSILKSHPQGMVPGL